MWLHPSLVPLCVCLSFSKNGAGCLEPHGLVGRLGIGFHGGWGMGHGRRGRGVFTNKLKVELRISGLLMCLGSFKAIEGPYWYVHVVICLVTFIKIRYFNCSWLSPLNFPF